MDQLATLITQQVGSAGASSGAQPTQLQNVDGATAPTTSEGQADTFGTLVNESPAPLQNITEQAAVLQQTTALPAGLDIEQLLAAAGDSEELTKALAAAGINLEAIESADSILLNTENNAQILLPVEDKTGLSEQSVNDILSRIPNALIADEQVIIAVEDAEINAATQVIAQEVSAQNTANLGAQTSQVVPLTKEQNQNTNNQAQQNKLVTIAQQTNVSSEANQKLTQNKHQQTITQNSANNILISNEGETGIKSAILGMGSSGSVQSGGEVVQATSGFQATAEKVASLNTTIRSPITYSSAAQTPPTEQISVRIANAISQGESKINIQLEPAHLGRVQVQIDMPIDGKSSIIVVADKQETLDALQKDARSLERALQEAGLQTDAGSLSFNLQGQQNPAQEGGEAYENGGGITSLETEQDLLTELTKGHLIYQSDRALDISV